MRIILFFTIVLSLTAYSQQQLLNISNRNTTSLNGEWSIIIDPYENGFYNYRYEENPNGYFKNAKPKTKSDLVEYDFDIVALRMVPIKPPHPEASSSDVTTPNA